MKNLINREENNSNSNDWFATTTSGETETSKKIWEGNFSYKAHDAQDDKLGQLRPNLKELGLSLDTFGVAAEKHNKEFIKNLEGKPIKKWVVENAGNYNMIFSVDRVSTDNTTVSYETVNGLYTQGIQFIPKLQYKVLVFNKYFGWQTANYGISNEYVEWKTIYGGGTYPIIKNKVDDIIIHKI